MAKEDKAKSAAKFKSSLKKFSLTEKDVNNCDLIVSPRSSVILSRSPKHASPLRPKVLQTTDLDVLKSWIGVGDDGVKSKTFISRRDQGHIKELRDYCKCHKSEPRAVRRNLLVSRIKEDKEPAAKSGSIRSYARSYLFGDSRLVAEAKPVLEDYYGVIEIGVWLFPNIKISSGSVLSFGPGSNVLLANELEIEEGGRIISYGSLTVNVTTLRKTNPRFVFPLVDLEIINDRFFRF
jgi:hypothetical protein